MNDIKKTGERSKMKGKEPVQKKGLIIVNTGEGKGKSTAAMGTALRACGWGMKVCMVQFIKGKWKPGEYKAAEKLGTFEILPMGEGFTWETKNRQRDTEVAMKAWEMCKEKALSGKYGLVIWDEINNVIDYGYVPLSEVVDFLKTKKPPLLHLILTGRGAKPEIIEIADLVTEMKMIKHPFDKGIIAQEGIEY